MVVVGSVSMIAVLYPSAANDSAAAAAAVLVVVDSIYVAVEEET